MRLMEDESASWIYCILLNLQGTEANSPQADGWTNDVVSLQETHGKEEFLQALQVLHTQFRMFGTFVFENVNAGGSAIFFHKNLLPDRAIVTHEFTCQGVTTS